MRLQSLFRVSLCLASALMTVSAQQQTSTLKVVTAAVSKHISSAPFIIAVEDGHFEREGIRVEYSALGRSRVNLPSLINGDIDVIMGGLSSGIINSIARGANIRLVAGVHTPSADACPSFALVVNNTIAKRFPHMRARDLKGLNIAGDRATMGQYFYEVLLASDGLSTKDILLVDGPSGTRPELLRKGIIDVAFLGEPELTKAVEESSAVLWKPVYDIVPEMQITFIQFGNRMLTEDPELGKKFILGYLRGVQQYLQGKTPRNIEILANTTGLDPEFLKRICWSPAEKGGNAKLGYLRDFTAWCVRQGLLDKEIPPEQIWDGRFVEYAQTILNQERK